jgi:hypothetical protein
VGLDALFRDYVAALDRHEIERVLALYAPDLVFRRLGEPVERRIGDLRRIREWEAVMQARFAAEVYATRRDWLSAKLEETNLLYSALDVRREIVAEYRFEGGLIQETDLRTIREAARPWREALAELEGWLAARPPAETAGILERGRLVFSAAAARRLLPLLEEWKRAVAQARPGHQAVFRSFVDAMDRHDVDAQYAHYAEGMAYLAEGRRVPPNRERERANREFEAAGQARWSHAVLGGGLDNLTALLTEDLELYRALGVGPRSSRRRVRFVKGRISEMEATEWTQAGRPYEGARDAFRDWLVREQPQAAAALSDADGLVFDARTAAPLAALAREWRRARPCTLYHPSYSPREPKLVFSSNCEGRWHVYRAEDDGSRPVRLTDDRGDARRPAWSPDGARVVFESNRDGDWDVYSIRADGSDLVRLTRQPGFDGVACYSPDGTRVLFASDRNGSRELFTMGADGSQPRALTQGGRARMRPAWSSDGSWILFSASPGPNAADGDPLEVFRIRPEGGDPQPLPGGPRREYNHAFAPDGTRIAFDAHAEGAWESDDGRWELWLMNADGSARRRLTDNSVNDWGPSWSPDGRRIVFLSGTNDVYDIYTIAADGSDRRRLTRWNDDFEGDTHSPR